MPQPSDARPLRATALLGASATTLGLLVGATRSARHPAGATFDSLLTAAAGWALLATLAWAVLVCAAAVLETLVSERLQVTARVCPAPLRGLLLPAVGLALATGMAAPGWAAPSGSATGLQGPTPTGTPVATSLPAPARPSDAQRASTVVHRGDTLWGLAAERVARSGASATSTDADVAGLVARTHRLNRAVVGPDPDLIRPGQRLALPRLSRAAPGASEQPSRSSRRHSQEEP